MINPRLRKSFSDYLNLPITTKRLIAIGAGVLFTLKLDEWREDWLDERRRGKTDA